MGTKLLTLDNIAKYYTSGQSVVMGLHNINLSFDRGEFVAITGESGSGKSTLAKVLAGIHTYENGEMYLNGKPTSHYDQADWERYRSRSISFISQSYDILPGCTVMKNVVSSLILTGMEPKLAEIQSEKILRQVELWDMRKRRAAKLSSGQKQRLSIARALAKPAPILIADEPTGNLDAENSAKVIELLTAAAKDRLVIIITHDFVEVENYATRHITIREGVVDSDVALRNNVCDNPPASTAPTDSSADTKEISAQAKSPKNKKQHKTNLSVYTARLQLGARPVWVFIMMLFFVLTAFSMFAFLGTFVVNLDDRFTRIYDNSAFYNGSDDMLVVMRMDGETLTEDDWKTILNIKYVESLERYGYISDVNYYYRENVDYFANYTADTTSDGNVTGSVTKTWLLGEPTLYMRTVPVLLEGQEFLTAGRLPENMYEVVMAAGENNLGKTFPVFLRYRGWAPHTYVLLNMTVVGVTDPSKDVGLYFDERLADTFSGHLQGSDYMFGYDRDYAFTLADLEAGLLQEYTLGGTTTFFPMEGRFRCSESMYKGLYDLARKSLSVNDDTSPAEKMYDIGYEFVNYTNPDVKVNSYFAFTHNSTYRHYIEVQEEVFEKLVPTDNYGTVVTVKIEDYSYANRVMDAINRKGYASISPYQMGSTEQDPELAAERLQTLKVCLLCFAAIFILQILVLRAMFGMEIDEFKLLASLGLRCNTAKLSVVWQLLLFTVCGQLIAFFVILACNQMQVERIVHIVKYLPYTYVLVFMLIHLCTGLLSAFWVQRSIGKQIYPFSLHQADLQMDEEEEV